MNLIVYGSLLNPDELKKHDIDMDRVKYVKVKGFKRVFNQEPSWRKVSSNKRAVLNIEEDQEAWFNAIAITDLEKEYFEDLDIRERGYDRLHLVNGDVVTYEGKQLDDCVVYKGKKDKQNSFIEPNEDYYKICLDGAKSHFEEFHHDYLLTTYKNKDGRLIRV
jgi:cation transport regulator ChaC